MLYNPTNRLFPAVSVTGEQCALNCKHCGGVYLQHMTPVMPESLLTLCRRENLNGVLISGGYTQQGKVPLSPFLPAIRTLKEEKDILINVHAGLINEQEVKALKKAGVDCVSFDFVVDEDVLRTVYGLERTPEEYVKSLKIASKYVGVAPHLCIDLNFGKAGRELEALDILSSIDIQKLVLLVLKSTPGTAMENVAIDKKHVLDVFEKASEFDKVALGCMRPRDREIEQKAYELGFDIAKPSFIKGDSKNVCCVF